MDFTRFLYWQNDDLGDSPTIKMLKELELFKVKYEILCLVIISILIYLIYFRFYKVAIDPEFIQEYTSSIKINLSEASNH
jgi:hypothetical protein